MHPGSRLRMLACALAAFGTLAVQPVNAQRAAASHSFVPGEVLVGFSRPGPNPNLPEAAAPEQIVQGVGRIMVHHAERGFARVELNRGVTMAQAIATLRGRPGVRYVEPNFLRHTTATPNDPRYAANQWGPQRVKMAQAWDIWQPVAQKVIAIIDTGVSLTHSDLVNVLHKDGMGNVIGYNAINPANSPADDHGHGTHCAGTAAGHINNGIGIAGIAGWNPGVGGSDAFVRIMPIKVIASNGYGTDEDVAEGIYWAADNGASVISMSLGGGDPGSTMADAVAYAIQNDVAVIAAAGNDSSTTPSYPGAFPNVVSVAATGSDAGDTLASFSNYGSWVKVAAPGVNIHSTLVSGSYGNMSGTSMATPHVAGEAVLIRAAYPNLTNLQVHAIIINNVDPYTPYGGRTLAAGAGRINVYKALQAAAVAGNGVISVELSPNPVTGGTSSTGTVTLGAVAPAGGKSVTLSSSSSKVSVPASVTVAAGQSSATFAATTQPVSTQVDAVITATVPEGGQTGHLIVNPPVVVGLSLKPASLAGGNSSLGTVTINGAAPSGGLAVQLTSSKPEASVPASVTVTEGAKTATFSVSTTPVTVSTSAVITAKTGSVSKSTTLTIKPPTPLSVVFTPKSVVGGASSSGKVTLNGPAPAGGVTVTLSSNKAQVTVPANVSIAAGLTSATFTASTTNVTANLTATVTATANGASKGGPLTLLPWLKSVAVSPTSVVGGKTATGTVTLNAKAPAGGLTVSLSDTNAAATVPASVTVLAGATTATFTVSTTPVSSNTTGTISGSLLGVTKQSGTFTVKPPALTSLKFSPSTIVQGANSTGTVTLSGPAPAAGTIVTLSSANSAVAPVPLSVTVASGATTATFTVTGGPVSTSTGVVITAKDPMLVTKTATLTVKP